MFEIPFKFQICVRSTWWVLFVNNFSQILSPVLRILYLLVGVSSLNLPH